MGRLSMKRRNLFVAAFFLVTTCMFSQDIPAGEILKRCNKKNPPPCATSAPRVLSNPSPYFSKEAIARSIQGTVVLQVVVGTDGRAHNITVTRSAGAGLDKEAIKAVKKWKFSPAANHGTTVPTAINLRFPFYFRPIF
jgi:TonB family protein